MEKSKPVVEIELSHFSDREAVSVAVHSENNLQHS